MKQRVPRPGQGRSGGCRVLMAFRSETRTVFVYGVAKNERENIGPGDLELWRRVASGFVMMTEKELAALLDAKKITEINCDD
ncbi:MAG: type II toxin-antitoxin system RelE/ParE family toxin [Alphaproteobacteria bacterium]|nr:type II toxin-antitoxin system RelE/ParE family toxin [Alphaproteobacteria bacterium]